LAPPLPHDHSPGRPARRLLLLAALLLVVAGCTPDRRGAQPPATTVPPRRGGELSVALVALRSVDPARAETDAERIVADSLFDGLTALDAAGQVVPAVAESWTADAAQRRFEFKLRPDAAFSGGAPVQAKDFVTAWQRVARSPNAVVRALLNRVEGAAAYTAKTSGRLTGVSAPDAGTFVVELTEPLADLPALAADPALAPVPAAATRPGWAVEPEGNGPFTLEEKPTPDGLVLTRNDTYSGAEPYLDSVRVSTVPDAQTAWLAFQEGQVQFAPVPVDQLEAARLLAGEGAGAATVVQGPAAALDVLGLNAAEAPLNDRDRRLAVSLAIDRERLAALFGGARVPADGLVPDGLRRGAAVPCEACGHDPARAKSLLGGAKVAMKLTIAPDPGERQMAALIAQDLKAVGISVETAEAPAGGVGVLLAEAGAALRRATAGAATSTAAGFLGAYYDDASTVKVTHLPDRQLGATIDRAEATGSEQVRLQLAGEAEVRAAVSVTAVPLLEYRQTAILAPGVQGFSVSPLGRIDLGAVSLTG
jgi:ABC-type transport system substrate-binding protein